MQHEHAVQMARDLTLPGFADALERQQSDPLYAELSFSERLAALLMAEKERRATKKLARLLKEARLPTRAVPEELITKNARGFKPEEMRELLRYEWVPHGWNILITGETGAGTTWVAACIATAAILAGYAARYFKTSDLLYSMSTTIDDGVYLAERQKLVKYRLLVLDDFAKVGMSEREKLILFDLIEDRSAGKLATVVVGQGPNNG